LSATLRINEDATWMPRSGVFAEYLENLANLVRPENPTLANWLVDYADDLFNKT
jgi:hypothetical protein